MGRRVEVVEADPGWPGQFRALREILAPALGDVALAIEHVGSTSVPGLAAKPILDVDVVIADRAALPQAVRRLAAIGYTHLGDRGVGGREAFRPDDVARANEPMRHNLYVCARDSDELARHLAFRDWMRAHPGDRDLYAELKRRLAVRFRHDVEAYCDAKTGFVESVLCRALGPGFCTARVVARPFRLGDVSYAHPVFADPEVMRFSAGEPDADMEATRARLARYIDLQTQRGFSKWALWDRDSGDYLGDAGLTVLPETGEVELGYRLFRAHWGRGLATEVATAWLAHALGTLGLPRVIGFADGRNSASIRVLEKIGMSFCRRDRLCEMDCVVYEATSR